MSLKEVQQLVLIQGWPDSRANHYEFYLKGSILNHCLVMCSTCVILGVLVVQIERSIFIIVRRRKCACGKT